MESLTYIMCLILYELEFPEDRISIERLVINIPPENKAAK
ncbi:MAG: hypothetical protein K0R21_623 [Anaerocolumna sp.]|jgi:hypothetical protein|nr:hypothetical protein [Anaerocolumna sp.]